MGALAATYQMQTGEEISERVPGLWPLGAPVKNRGIEDDRTKKTKIISKTQLESEQVSHVSTVFRLSEAIKDIKKDIYDCIEKNLKKK